MRCKRCGSYAINPNSQGRDDSDADLCDVCYWRKRVELAQAALRQVEFCLGFCVWCGRAEYDGHAHDCARQVALGANA